MKAPKLIRECPLRSSQLTGDAREFFCTVCKKDVTNLSILEQRDAEDRVFASNVAESCGMWLEDREGNLVQGPRALEILKRMIAAGTLAASIQRGSFLVAGEAEKSKVSKEVRTCESREEKVPEQTKCDSGNEEEIILLTGFYVNVESEVDYSPIEGRMVALPKKPKALKFHKKR